MPLGRGGAQTGVHVGPHQLLQKEQPVNLADHLTSVAMACDVRWVPGEQIAHDLVDGIVPPLLESPVDVPKNVLNPLTGQLADLKDAGTVPLFHGNHP